jgi:hypothetical protein
MNKLILRIGFRLILLTLKKYFVSSHKDWTKINTPNFNNSPFVSNFE